MTRTRTVARLELRLLWAGGRGAAVAALLLIAAGLALFATESEVRVQWGAVEEARWEHEVRLARAREGAEWLEFPTHQDRVPIVSFVAPQPPGRFGVLSLGQRDVLPQALAWVPEENATHSPPHPTADGRVLYGLAPVEVTSAPLSRLLGPFDLAFVVVYLLPLALFALTFDLLGSERESGRLALLRSQPVGTGALVGGKLLVRGGLVLAAGVAVPLLVAAILAAGRQQGDEPWSALWLCSGATVLYATFWLGLGAWVDSRGRHVGSNALLLTGAWLAVTVLIPAVTVQLAERVAPPPSSVRFAQETRPLPELAYHEYHLTSRALRDAFAEAYRPDPSARPEADPQRRAEAWVSLHVPPELERRPWIRTFLDRNPGWSRPLTYWQADGAAKEAERQETEFRARALVERYVATRERHLALANRLALLSPALLLQEVMDAVAGSDLGRHQRFVEELDLHARELQQPFVSAMKAGRAITPDEIGDARPFRFERPVRWAELGARLALPLAGLLAFALLGAALTVRACRPPTV